MIKRRLTVFWCIILVLAIACAAGATNSISYPKFKAWDHNGYQLSGGKLYSYLPHTSTKTNTFSNPELTVPNTNPVILNSVGEASVYIDGSCKLELKNSQNVTIWTVDDVTPETLWTFSPAQAGVFYSSVLYGGSQATLVAAIATVGSTQATIYLAPSDWIISADLTIPANITLKPERGATLVIQGGKTLTINGPLDAGLYQIFSCVGTGKVVFGPGTVQAVHPEWWGAKADGATECLPALVAALTTEIPVQLSNGTYKATWAATTYLNTTSYDMQYKIKGQGFQTILDIHDCAVNTYLFTVNQSSGGVTGVYIPVHPRMIVEDVNINGANSTNAGFIKTHYAGVLLRNVEFHNMYHGVYADVYNDMISCENVAWYDGRVDGWTVKYEWLGDGFLAKNCFDARFKLKGVRGGNLISNIGGYVEIESAKAISMTGNHMEPHSGTETSLIKIIDSQVSLAANYLNNTIQNPIIIDDTGGTRRGSNVILDNNLFYTLITAAGTERLPDVVLTGFSWLSNLTLRQNRSARVDHEEQLGIVATSTDDVLLDAVLQNSKHLLSGDVRIERSMPAGLWRVTPPNAIREFCAIDAPEFGYVGIEGASQYGWSDLVAGTQYFYAIAAFHDGGSTQASAETSATPTSSNKVAVFQTIVWGSPAYTLRIWRGTTTGTYDRYVDIPMTNPSVTLTDRGAHIAGFPWITSAVPAVPAANTTMAGYMFQGKRTFRAAAAPSSAAFTGIVGDVVENSVPAVQNPKGWRCTVAGTPGTWVSEGNL